MTEGTIRKPNFGDKYRKRGWQRVCREVRRETREDRVKEAKGWRHGLTMRDGSIASTHTSKSTLS